MPNENRRVEDHPILGPSKRGAPVTFWFNGAPITGCEGENIAMALWASGIKVMRSDLRSGEPRGMYCGIGHCFECRVTVNGVPDIRACLEPVRPGLIVSGEVSGEEGTSR